jgi:filamentous hemagglutinin family protein
MIREQSFARNPVFRRRLLPVLIAGCFGSGAFANPVGPQVINGQATFSSQGNVLSVTNTPGAIINWQGFSINPGEITRFLQQNANSGVLNRVVGQDPTQILGALQSNGRVFLINPNGILFGQGAQIDVNGLVASTLNISNDDFISGKLNFKAGDKAGNLKNQGAITTPAGGQVYLIAPNVENSGIITSPKGEVMLAAGHTVQLVDSVNPELRVVLSAPEHEALNLGTIIAQGGKTGIYGALVKQRGVISADSAVVGENGKVVFKASRETILDAGSKTTATSAGTGGEVIVQGEQVGLFGDARINASGAQGGGTVLIGGDYRGGNAAVQNAQVTYLDKDSVIQADALGSGDGGKVIAWADNTTRAYGSISARGGAQSGNGGFVETSGKKFLDVTRAPDIAAPKGKAGQWLLDPETITISSAANTNIAGGSPFVPSIAGTASVLLDSTLAAALNAGGTVTVDTTSTIGGTTGNIVVDSSAAALSALSPISPATLNLYAYNDINVNASIKATGGQSLSMNFIADKYSQAGTTGAISVAGGVELNSRNGTVAMTSKGAINLGASAQVTGGSGTLNFTSSAGNFTMAAGSQLNSASNIGVTASTIDVQGDIKHFPDLSSTATVTLTASGNINLSGLIEGDNTDSTYTVKLQGTGTTVSTPAGKTLTLDGIEENVTVEVGNGKTWTNNGTVNLNNKSAIRLYDGSIFSTFTNASGAQFNSDTSNNWAFLSDSSSQAGTVNNNGTMAIGTNNQSFEAKFNQGTSGSLSVNNAITLSLQNAQDVRGTINLPAGALLGSSGTLWVSENHSGPATFTNTSFTGPGEIQVYGATAAQAVFSNSNSTTNPLRIGNNGAVTINGNGVSSFSNLTNLAGGSITSGLTLANGTLGITGNFTVPASGVTYQNSVGYYATGALTVPATAAINTSATSGSIALIGGWNGNSASPAATGAGGITIADSQVITNGAGTVTLKAGTAGISTSGTGTGAGGLFLQGGKIGLDSIGSITIGKLDGDVVARTTGAGAPISIHDPGALVVGTSAVGSIPAGFVTNNSNISLTADAGILKMDAPVNAGTGTVTLNSTLAMSGTGTITGGTLNLQSVGNTGDIGTSSSPLQTSSPGGSGNANISVGFNATGPASVYLNHTGDATVQQLFTTGAGTPVGITTSGSLSTASIGTGTSDLTLTAGNLLTVSAGANLSGANITFIADRMSLQNSAGATNAGSGLLWLKPATAGKNIDLGSSSDLAGGPLGLSATELGTLSGTGTLRIGTLTSGNGTLSAPVTVAGFNVLSLESGGTITQSTSADVLTANKLAVKALGDVKLAAAPNAVANLAAQVGNGSNPNKSLLFKSGSGLTIASGLDGVSGITTTGTGEVVLRTDTLTLSDTVTANLVQIRPVTTGRNITVGSSTCASSPCLAVYDLYKIVAPTVGIGTEDSINLPGAISVSGITVGGATASDRNAATTRIGLLAGGAVTQTNPIIVQDLGVVAGGAITLNAANQVTNFAAKTAGTAVAFTDTTAFDVTSMSGGTLANGTNYSLSGITTSNGNVTLNLTGTSASQLGIPGQINAGTGTVSLVSSGSVYGSGTSPDIIGGLVDVTATGGSIDGGGGLHINSPRIASLSAPASSINVLGFQGLTIGQATSTPGTVVNAGSTVTIKTNSPYPITVNGGITAVGNISLTAGTGSSSSLSSTSLTINQPITSTSGTITLAANNVGGTSVPSGPNVTLQTFSATTSSGGSSTPPPTVDQCVANPGTAGCDTVLPTLSTCTSAPSTAGCSAVLPTISTCTTSPSTAGCTAVLPTISTCTTAPTTEGCTAVLPTLSTCTASPSTAGCSAVLPSVSTCTTSPTTTGCSAVLPSLSTCTTSPSTAGCTAVLPTLSTCTTSPSTAGCTAVLPSVSTCTTAPSTTGCSVVLPTLSTCTTAPTTAGCSVVLPALSQCTAAPTLAGCSAVLPSLSQCSASPTTAGCEVVLPIASQCTLNPSAAGCTTVLPTTQAGDKEKVTETVTLTTNTVVNSTLISQNATASQGGGSGASSGGGTSEKSEGKKDDRKTTSGVEDNGAKKNEPAKKMYCN